MKNVFPVILLVFYWSCSGNKRIQSSEDNNSASQTNTQFNDFIGVIPKQSLPIRLSCGLPDDARFTHEFEKFEQFIPTSVDRIFGIIENSKEQNLIMYGQTGDDINPVLFTYDKNGEIIDSLFLMIKGCGSASENQIPHSYVLIDQDLIITMEDTTQYIHEVNDSDYALDSIRIKKIVKKITQNGTIKDL